MATTSGCKLVKTTNIPMKTSNRIKYNAMDAILKCLDWFLRKIIIVTATTDALTIASNLWIFSCMNFGAGSVNPLGQRGHSVQDIPSRVAVIDLPEIIVLKISANEINVNTNIFLNVLPPVASSRILIYNTDKGHVLVVEDMHNYGEAG